MLIIKHNICYSRSSFKLQYADINVQWNLHIKNEFRQNWENISFPPINYLFPVLYLKQFTVQTTLVTWGLSISFYTRFCFPSNDTAIYSSVSLLYRLTVEMKFAGYNKASTLWIIKLDLAYFLFLFQPLRLSRQFNN